MEFFGELPGQLFVFMANLFTSTVDFAAALPVAVYAAAAVPAAGYVIMRLRPVPARNRTRRRPAKRHW